MTAHAFGWRPQTPDHRDRLYHLEESILHHTEVPPTGGIPRDETPPVWNQAQEGSCTAHGSLGVFVTEAIRQGVTLPAAPPGGAPLSRQAQYYWTRLSEGTQASDSGAQVRDAIKTLVRTGAIPESEWPYEPGNMFTAPPATLEAQARQHLAVKYQSVRVGAGGAPMRTALVRRLGIVFGFSVPRSFEDGSWDPASGEPLPLPAATEGFIGGHCVWARAYDFSCSFTSGPYGSYRRPPFFTCRNSWVQPDGSPWGMDGEFNMHYDWFSPERGLASDLWVVQKVSPQ